MERISLFSRLRERFRMERERKKQEDAAAISMRAGEKIKGGEVCETRVTDRYSRDLTRLAALGKLDPLIGREYTVVTFG